MAILEIRTEEDKPFAIDAKAFKSPLNSTDSTPLRLLEPTCLFFVISSTRKTLFVYTIPISIFTLYLSIFITIRNFHFPFISYQCVFNIIFIHNDCMLSVNWSNLISGYFALVWH